MEESLETIYSDANLQASSFTKHNVTRIITCCYIEDLSAAIFTSEMTNHLFDPYDVCYISKIDLSWHPTASSPPLSLQLPGYIIEKFDTSNNFLTITWIMEAFDRKPHHRMKKLSRLLQAHNELNGVSDDCPLCWKKHCLIL